MAQRVCLLVAVLFLMVDAAAVRAEKFRVVTYNIRQGKGQREMHTPSVDIDLPFGLGIHIPSKPFPFSRGHGQLDKIADRMKQLNPDVVSLQEVNTRSLLSLGQDQAAYIADRMGMHHAYATAQADGKVVKRQGNAILSRHRIAEKRVVVLSPALGQNERRIALFARIMLPGHADGVWIASIHAESNSEEVRVESVPRLVDAVRAMTQPVVLTGDFNTKPDRPPMQNLFDQMAALGRPLTDAFAAVGVGPDGTSGAPEGRYRIDYVLSTPELRPVSARSPRDINEADHFPVVAELETVAGAATVAATGAPAGADSALLGIGMMGAGSPR